MENQAVSHRRDPAWAHRRKIGAGDWLALAAAPTFAAMAALTALGGETPDLLCGIAPDATGLTGMVPMYALMSLFHLAPWLRLTGRPAGGSRRGRTRQPERIPLADRTVAGR